MEGEHNWDSKINFFEKLQQNRDLLKERTLDGILED